MGPGGSYRPLGGIATVRPIITNCRAAVLSFVSGHHRVVSSAAVQLRISVLRPFNGRQAVCI